MKLNIDKSVLNFLIDFGLTEKEITVYMTLLKTGPNTIMNLARETGIKRSTTHNTVEELIKKGLVSQTNYGERRMVIAEDPEKLSFLMDQKKWDITKLEKNLPDVVKSIYSEFPKARENTQIEVKYYDGEKGFKEVCQRSITNSSKEVLCISNIDEWRKVYTEEYGKEYYIPARKKKNLFLRELAINTPKADKFQDEDKKLLRETRILPESFDFNTTMFITDKDVSIMISSEPYKAISIEEKDVVSTFKNIFENLWKLSENT